MSLNDAERTMISAAPPVRVRIERGEARRSAERFERKFTLGRSNQCDIQFDDPQVSSRHAEVAWERGGWWVQDLKSTNGTYLNGARIERAALPAHATLELARGGPVVVLTLEQPLQVSGINELSPAASSLTLIAQRYFGPKLSGKLGEQTMIIRQAFHKIRRKHAKRYWTAIGIILLLLAGTAGALFYQSRRVKELERLHGLAENIFYQMKALELRIAALDSAAAREAGAVLKKQQADYNEFARNALGISPDKLSEKDWLIYKIARLFGECDVSMPPGFVQKVQIYIRKWQSTPRLRKALERATTNGYSPQISSAMLTSDMPPQFFYLALQESDFDLRRCGPRTRYGIAKGMWQFIPATAIQYGLRTGPLLELPRHDPRDERHHFEKSTQAAAKYLRDLYKTEAQASGLLVMACYNWGQGNVLELVKRMPKNPRERNFWRLLATAKIPQETYDYVFYIVSAAVIGENPRLFGFDFDSPLQ
jgi:pSer/pThr/pTyr-binding forkhead associated (FHA) protein